VSGVTDLMQSHDKVYTCRMGPIAGIAEVESRGVPPKHGEEPRKGPESEKKRIFTHGGGGVQ